MGLNVSMSDVCNPELKRLIREEWLRRGQDMGELLGPGFRVLADFSSQDCCFQALYPHVIGAGRTERFRFCAAQRVFTSGGEPHIRADVLKREGPVGHEVVEFYGVSLGPYEDLVSLASALREAARRSCYSCLQREPQDWGPTEVELLGWRWFIKNYGPPDLEWRRSERYLTDLEALSLAGSESSE